MFTVTVSANAVTAAELEEPAITFTVTAPANAVTAAELEELTITFAVTAPAIAVTAVALIAPANYAWGYTIKIAAQ